MADRVEFMIVTAKESFDVGFVSMSGCFAGVAGAVVSGDRKQAMLLLKAPMRADDAQYLASALRLMEPVQDVTYPFANGSLQGEIQRRSLAITNKLLGHVKALQPQTPFIFADGSKDFFDFPAEFLAWQKVYGVVADAIFEKVHDNA
jgi:hypothetical protein